MCNQIAAFELSQKNKLFFVLISSSGLLFTVLLSDKDPYEQRSPNYNMTLFTNAYQSKYLPLKL